MSPCMVVARDDEQRIIGSMLAVIRYRTTFIPPFVYKHCLIIGEGEYTQSLFPKEVTFRAILHALIEKLSPLLLHIEVSNLSSKMFGYKEFKQEDFFHVKWMSVRNSLHSKSPEERISEKTLQRINKAYERGATTIVVETEDDFQAFYRLLKKHNTFKPKRYIPDEMFFRGMMEAQDDAKLFVTKYKNKVIGCCACSYSGDEAHLWYFAARRKSYIFQHPDLLTVWYALKDAHSRGYAHFTFMDVGLPFKKSPFREFILNFGGKPISTYRWFRFSNRFVNKILSALFK